jgi:hypothetical protein
MGVVRAGAGGAVAKAAVVAFVAAATVTLLLRHRDIA